MTLLAKISKKQIFEWNISSVGNKQIVKELHSSSSLYRMCVAVGHNKHCWSFAVNKQDGRKRPYMLPIKTPLAEIPRSTSRAMRCTTSHCTTPSHVFFNIADLCADTDI